MKHEVEKATGADTYYCPDCGSDEIYFDGQVQWNPESGSWNLLEVHSRPWCAAWDHEIYKAVFGDPTCWKERT